MAPKIYKTDTKIFDAIEKYLLETEKRYRGKKILFVIGMDVWDSLAWHSEYYQEAMKRAFSFEISELSLKCLDGVTRSFEYYVDDFSSASNGNYDQQIRAYIQCEKKDFYNYYQKLKG